MAGCPSIGTLLRSFGHALALLAVIALALPAHAQAESPAADPLPGVRDEMIWTDRPVKIDRARQTYERLPALIVPETHPSGLSVPRFIKVIDSATFAFGGKTYRIRNILPVRQGRICKTESGRRWACGRMSAIHLGLMVRGRRIHCDTPTKEGDLTLVDCRIGQRSIAREIILKGYGHATGDEDLIAAERDAVAAKAGLWQNPECLKNFRSC